MSRAAYFREYRRRRKLAAGRGDPNGPATALSLPGIPAAPPAPTLDIHPIPEATDDPGGAVVKWAEKTLRVPDGPLQGRPFTIDAWQAEFLRAALAPGIREAGLSVARKNGKSGLIAALLLAFLCGPLLRPGWRGVVTSMTGELAKELRNAVESIKDLASLPVTVLRSPTPGRIVGPHRTRLDFLAADKATGHAIGADLAIIDEAGLLPESRRSLWNAILSSTSGRDGRLICISIQGDGPMFRELKERAPADDSVVFHLFAAPPGCEMDDPEVWHRANPGLRGGTKSMSYMRDMARRAQASPADQPAFRAYDLNLPAAPDREMICTPEDWDRCTTEDLPERDGLCVVSFDLGGTSSMTCLTALWPRTGRMEVRGAFPGMPDLQERGTADGVGGLYVQMKEAGELTTYPGRVTPVALFLSDCADDLEGERIVAAGCDTYRQGETRSALTEARLHWPIAWRGTGKGDRATGSHDIRAFQRAVLRRRLRVRPSMLMTHAIAESSIERDPYGNPMLDKSRLRGRIDALQAAVIATGLWETWETKERRGRSRSAVLHAA